MKKQNKQYFYPLRDAKSSHKVTLIPISEKVYREICLPIEAKRKRLQYISKKAVEAACIDLDALGISLKKLGNSYIRLKQALEERGFFDENRTERLKAFEKLKTPCRCPFSMAWKCDGHCDLCEYFFPAELSLDNQIGGSEESESFLDQLEDPRANFADILADRSLLDVLFDRLRELDPNADTIIHLWQDNPDISDRAIAKDLGISQSTFSKHMKDVRRELKKLLDS